MIVFTDEAVAFLNEALEPQDAVRVGVVGGGCSGLRYSLEIEETSDKKEHDEIVEYGDVIIHVDPYSAEVLSDTIVHYVDDQWNAGFKFKNMKAANTCGCGASFSEAQSCGSNTDKAE